jgi:plastocyanin
MKNRFRSASCTCVLATAVFVAGCSQTTPPASKSETPPPQKAVEKPVYFKVDPGTAGTVTGKILFTGKAPARKKIDFDEDPQCAKLHTGPFYDETVKVGGKGTVANAFVYIKKGLEGKKFEPPSDPVVIDQHGCWFEPRVIGMQAGQELKAVNSDPVTHNIHPRAKVNREWNQNQPEGAEPAIRKFAFPEVMIRVKCNIHAWMKAWIGVVDNPYFAVTGDNGSFEMKNVPPGVYTVEAWQEELGTQEQQVTVAASGKAAADFTFKGE